MSKYFLLEAVEAFKWTGDHLQDDDPIWAVERIASGRISFGRNKIGIFMIIKNVTGTLHARPGDWIVLRHFGEVQSYSDDVFRELYHPAEAEKSAIKIQELINELNQLRYLSSESNSIIIKRMLYEAGFHDPSIAQFKRALEIYEETTVSHSWSATVQKMKEEIENGIA